MSNHLHLAVRLAAAGGFAATIADDGRVAVVYVHYFNRRYRFVGHLWQGRFKSPAIKMETYLLSCGRYIERNPLTAGLCELPWDFAWSRGRAYALGEPDPLGEDAKESAIASEDWLVGAATFRSEAQHHEGRPSPRQRGRPQGGNGTFST